MPWNEKAVADHERLFGKMPGCRSRAAGKVLRRDDVWYASLRVGNVVRTVEAGLDRDCAEVVLQLMREGKR